MSSADTASRQPSGILLLDKPPGESSFAALYPVKRAFGGRKGAKIGHAGTLDPAASGLLVIGVGAGTRLLEFLEAMPKSYRFRLNLGVVTDTYDLEGTVLERKDASAITREDIEARLDAFRGPIAQTPPAYSAIKIDGKRAYARARAGEAVEIPARSVRVDRLEILSFDPRGGNHGPTAVMELDCSKGTYVRSLAHDLGQLLGCGAAADQIRRLAIGPFRVEDAVVLAHAGPDALLPALLPLERAVRHLPALRVKDSWIPGLLNGNAIPAAGYAAIPGVVGVSNHDDSAEAASSRGTFANGDLIEHTPLHAVFSPAGELVAIATLGPLGQLRPRKVFPAVSIAPAA